MSPTDLAKKLLGILSRDRIRLQRIDNYIHGKHDDPYMPADADDEYKMLASRAVSNWMPLLITTPCQALYVDGFRKGRSDAPSGTREIGRLDAEWDHWQQSRLDARQLAIHRAALGYGHAFTLTEKAKGRIITKGLDPLATSALFVDPANDVDPKAALTVIEWPANEGKKRGKARMWDGSREYLVSFKDLDDPDHITVADTNKRHGTECPVTRFAATVDLSGRTIGVVEPMIQLQNRINQTVFDLLIAQTYGSFQIRTATGMAPPIKMKAVTNTAPDGTEVPTGELEPVIDPVTQMPVMEKVRVNASRFMYAEDPDSKFGTLEGTPLDGYINSIDMSIRHLAAISQTPPHHLLGQIANLSAEALQAAETALARKIEEFRKSFGESWERVFRFAAALAGDTAAAEDFHGEVLWRDMEARSLAQSADALLKLKDLGVPTKGLWRRVPNVTQTELNSWDEMLDRDPAAQQALLIRRSDERPTGDRLNTTPLRSEAA